MTNPYRALCAELVEAYAWCIEEYMTAPAEEDALIKRARALLAEPVAEGPTDEALINLADDSDLDRFEGERSYIDGTVIFEGYWEAWDHQLLAFARAALARWGRPTPQPPADGEVAELVEWLQSMRDLAGEHNPDEQRRYTRAAELLERPTPQPVAVSERLPGPEDCEAGECWGWDVAAEAWNRTHYAVCNHYTHWLPANALPTPITT